MNELFQGTFLFSEDSINLMHFATGPWLDWLMVAVTALGSLPASVAVLSVLFWCVDKKTAVRAGAIFFMAGILNSVVKEICNTPRPDPTRLIQPVADLYRLYAPRSPSFPSGHTANAASLWGSIGYYLRNVSATAAAIFVIVAVPFSRLYLGVHYPGDVIGGYLVALAVMAVMVPLLHAVEGISFRPVGTVPAAAVTLVPWAVFAFYPAMYMLKNMSLFAGLVAGLLIADGKNEFDTRGEGLRQILKVIIGIAVTGALFAVQKIACGHMVVIFILYWLIGFWITLGAPLVFARLGLSRECQDVT